MKEMLHIGDLESSKFAHANILAMASITKKWGDKDEWGWQRAAEKSRTLVEPIDLNKYMNDD